MHLMPHTQAWPCCSGVLVVVIEVDAQKEVLQVWLVPFVDQFGDNCVQELNVSEHIIHSMG